MGIYGLNIQNEVTGLIDVMIFIAALETEEERSMAARIFEKYQNAMYWTAQDVLKNRADAEDALMKAAENICQHIHDFDGLSENDIKRKVMWYCHPGRRNTSTKRICTIWKKCTYGKR